jgi:hypothetical protein
MFPLRNPQAADCISPSVIEPFWNTPQMAAEQPHLASVAYGMHDSGYCEADDSPSSWHYTVVKRDEEFGRGDARFLHTL